MRDPKNKVTRFIDAIIYKVNSFNHIQVVGMIMIFRSNSKRFKCAVKRYACLYFTILLILLNTFGVTVFSENSSSDWPMQFHDSKHTGYTPDAVVPPLQLDYVIEFGDIQDGFVSLPVIANGEAFVLSREREDTSVVVRIYVMDPLTGSLLRSFNLYGVEYPCVSPAVADGTIYVSTEILPSRSGLYAIDILSGRVLWSYNTTEYFFSPPTVKNGMVYMATGPGGGSQLDWGYIYALNASTGNLLWNFPLVGGAKPSATSPTVDDGRVFISSSEGDLYALDAKSGFLIWSSRGYHPTVKDGILYVANTGSIHALHTKTGQEIWRSDFSIGREEFVRQSIAVSENMVFAAAREGLFSFNRTNGRLIWNSTSGMDIDAFSIADNIVYAHSNDVGLIAFNATTGEILWQYPIWCSHPVIANGIMYVRVMGKYSPGARSSDAKTRIYAFKESSEWWSDLASRNFISEIVQKEYDNWREIRLFWSNSPIKIITNSTVLGATINQTKGQLVMILAGVHGTKGVLNITIPKSFVPSSSDIKIYLNSNPMNFTFTQYESFAVAQIEYHHSEQELQVDFPMRLGSEARTVNLIPRTENFQFFMLLASVVGIVGVVVIFSTYFVYKRRKKFLSKRVLLK